MEYKIYALILGTIETDSSLTLARYNPGVKYTSLVPAFLILGGEKTILVETGFRDVQTMLNMGSRNPTYKPEWDIVAQLVKFNIKPEDVDLIIYTHLHADHCGQTFRFPKAKIVVQREELRTAAAPIVPDGAPWGGKAMFYVRRDISTLLDDYWDQLIILDGEEEIMPGIRCIHVGGHTRGSQAVYVKTAKGIAILGGDNCYRFENFENGPWPPGQIFGSWDETVLAIKRYIKEGKYIIPSHDMKIFEKYPNGKIPP